MPTASTNVLVANPLPQQIIAIDHATLDRAMALCESAHAIVIPSPTLDETGCRSALARASTLYDQVNDLSKELEAGRLERGRELAAIKSAIDAAVKAAVVPLEDQRAKLGAKLVAADRALKQVVEEQRAAAERERVRREAESRAAAEAARKAQEEAEAAARAAEQARLDAERAANVAAMRGIAPLPDDPAIVAAARAAEAADAAAKTAAEATTASMDRVFDAVPVRRVQSAPSISAKASKSYALVIDDLALVPREVAGIPLWTLDESACTKLLKLNPKAIPGLRLVETETTGAKGRSNAFAV